MFLSMIILVDIFESLLKNVVALPPSDRGWTPPPSAMEVPFGHPPLKEGDSLHIARLPV